MTYIASDDVDATAEKIRGAGGTVLMDPFDVFDAGRMTIATDPSGSNRNAVPRLRNGMRLYKSRSNQGRKRTKSEYAWVLSS